MIFKNTFKFKSILFAIIVLLTTTYTQAQEFSSHKKTQNKILQEDIDNDGDLDKIELQLNETKTQVALSLHLNNGNDTYEKPKQIGYINDISVDVDYQIFKDKHKRTLILFGKKHNGNEINLNHSRIYKLPEF
ncbi:MAG: hypothetical protein COA67_05230 [Lutibacter sp.]|nr:MAG: hypothetical protein COA67_05230 [Lutibacter sp.]